MQTSKKVLIYPPSSKIHTAYNSLLSNPPEGYTFFQTAESTKEKIFNYLKKFSILRKIYSLFLKIFKTTKILELSGSSEQTAEADLIFSRGYIYKGKKPYVIDIIDNAYCLAGYNYPLFIHNLKKIEKSLLDYSCKKIICANESSLQTMKKYFSKKVLEKTVLVRPSIKPLNFENERSDKKVRFLFMGSINNPNDFDFKGGLNTIEVFNKLSKKYNNIELVLRSKVPEEIKKRIKSNKKIILIENEISFKEVIGLYASSHILLCPSHTYLGLMALLESMSFKLPILAIDTYAVRDYVINNFNGFIIKKSNNVKGYYDQSYPTNVRSKEFLNEIKNIDISVINDLVEKAEILITNTKLRKRMGENSRKLINSKFSIRIRNKELKKIFDAAVK
ncbi:MAG: glycosyltransferase [Nanoarchaeota archaeon]